MMAIHRLRTLLFAGILATGLVLLGGCDGAGAGGSGGSSSGGSATITLEADRSYYPTDPDILEFSIQYSWFDPADGNQAFTGEVIEDDITLPWTWEDTLEAGTSVSINLMVHEDHTNNVTLMIYENGNTPAQHVIKGPVTDDGLPRPFPALTHVVGQ